MSRTWPQFLMRLHPQIGYLASRSRVSPTLSLPPPSRARGWSGYSAQICVISKLTDSLRVCVSFALNLRSQGFVQSVMKVRTCVCKFVSHTRTRIHTTRMIRWCLCNTTVATVSWASVDLDRFLERTASRNGLLARGRVVGRAVNNSLHDERARLNISSQ